MVGFRRRSLGGLLLIAGVLAFLQPALAEDSMRTKLVGLWAEIAPSDNLVAFDANGSWKLYLKKGEVGELKSLDGKWVLSDDGKLRISAAVGERKLDMAVRLSFEGEEMVLTEEDGSKTRHRRHTGPIPSKYQ